MIDLARDDMAEAVENAFRYSKLVLATTTYNAEIFPFMHTFITHLTERNFQGRTVGLIENGSWGPQSGKLMGEIVSSMKNMTLLGETVSVKSSVKEAQCEVLKALADALAADIMA